jgi:hypothetical protein
MPMAARRALDRAGVKLSLRAWRALAASDREAIAQMGEEEIVNRARVLALTGDAPAIDVQADPPSDRVPDDLRAALGDRAPDDARWRSLGVLERYVLASYARRGRTEKLAAACDHLLRRS